MPSPPSKAQSWFDRLIKIVAALFLALLLLFTALMWLQSSPRFELLYLALTGASQCPLRLALDSADHVQEVTDMAHRIEHGLKIVRTDAELQLWDSPHGSFWVPANSVPRRVAIVLAEMESGIYGRGERAVRKGDIVLDCGAADGFFTALALRQGAARVVSIEPLPDRVACLRRTFAPRIAAGQVVVYPKGVWNETKEASFDAEATSVNGAHPSITVQLTTIDRIVAELRLPRVDFIKMDIEGAEKPALAGARETLRKSHPRISIATEHYPDDAVAIPKLIRSIAPGYQAECGPCEYADRHIRPAAMYFWSPR